MLDLSRSLFNSVTLCNHPPFPRFPDTRWHVQDRPTQPSRGEILLTERPTTLLYLGLSAPLLLEVQIEFVPRHLPPVSTLVSFRLLITVQTLHVWEIWTSACSTPGLLLTCTSPLLTAHHPNTGSCSSKHLTLPTRNSSFPATVRVFSLIRPVD